MFSSKEAHTRKDVSKITEFLLKIKGRISLDLLLFIHRGTTFSFCQFSAKLRAKYVTIPRRQCMDQKSKIDLLKEKYELEPEGPKSFRFLGRILLVLVIFVSIGGAALSYEIASSNDGSSFPKITLFSTLKSFVVSGDRQLEGEEVDRVNFLLTGIGGEGHDGPQLTDTIIFASYKPSTGQVGMISIPRDMTVPIPGYGWRKVNHANAYGEMQEPGTGPSLAIQVIEEVLAEDIQYYVRVDFDGFSKLIDDVGGIDVYIDNTFTDYNYPSHGKAYAECGSTTQIDEDGEAVSVATYGCRFETLHFEEGWTHMDGDTALKYVRSRKGTNGEGSDFARALRQQKVIVAVKEKVFSAETFLNPARINRILDTLQDNIATNLDTWELIRLANEFKDKDLSDVTSHVLDSSEDSPLYATSLNGAYVLLPKNDDWSAVQNLAENIFEADALSTAIAATEPSEEKPQFVRVEIQNGTGVSGLAFRTSQLLDGQGFDIVKIGNAADRNFTHTAIYDLTNGQRPEELKSLRDYLDADVTLSATGWLVNGDIIPKELSLTSHDYEELATEPNIDFLIILGENSANLVRN